MRRFRYRAGSFRSIGRRLNGNSLFIRHQESQVTRVIAAVGRGVLHIGRLETRPMQRAFFRSPPTRGLFFAATARAVFQPNIHNTSTVVGSAHLYQPAFLYRVRIGVIDRVIHKRTLITQRARYAHISPGMFGYEYFNANANVLSRELNSVAALLLLSLAICNLVARLMLNIQQASCVAL